MAADEKRTRTRLKIRGDMTIYQATRLKHRLIASLNRGLALDIDLSAVTELDTAGVQLLLLAKHEAARADIGLRLQTPSPTARAVLEQLNLLQHFDLTTPMDKAED